jgi:glycosyltransferase involved in cell wall biosynthesis
MAATHKINPASKTTRILYLIDSLQGDGAERQLCELVKAVHGTEGFEPHVGVLEDSDAGHAWMLEELGIPVEVFERRSRFDLKPVTQIVRYIREQNIDLVHAYMLMGCEFGLFAAKFCRVPVIASSIQNGKNRDWREAVRTYYQSHWADRGVANSQAGFDARFKKVRPSFRVIHNGFHPDRFQASDADKSNLRAQLEIPDGARVISMAARMEPQKDHHNLLEAMHIVLRSAPNVILLFAGHGELEQSLKADARRLGIENNVQFLGYRRDVECIMSISDVAVLLTNTDIHHEGISNTIIESMAVGAAMIATRGGGTDEVLGDEDLGRPPYTHGIKVDAFRPDQVADAILYYLNNEAERARIADAGRSMVLERFDIGRFIDENVDLYRELI